MSAKVQWLLHKAALAGTEVERDIWMDIAAEHMVKFYWTVCHY